MSGVTTTHKIMCEKLLFLGQFLYKVRKIWLTGSESYQGETWGKCNSDELLIVQSSI